MSGSVIVTQVTYDPVAGFDPPGENLFRLGFLSPGPTIFSVTAGEGRTRVYCSFSHTNHAQVAQGSTNAGPYLNASLEGPFPLVLPFTIAAGVGTPERGVDYEIYATETTTIPFLGEHFVMLSGEMEAELWFESLETTNAETVTITLGTASETGELLSIVAIDPNFPTATVALRPPPGAGPAPDIGWENALAATLETTTQNVIRAFTTDPGTGVNTEVPGGGCSVDVTVGGTATYTTDYALQWDRIRVGQLLPQGALAAGTSTLNLLAGDIGFLVRLLPVEDYTTEGDESVTLVLSNPTSCTLGAITTHTHRITDNSRSGTLVYMLREVSTILEPATGSGTYQVGQVYMGDVDPSNNVSVDIDISYVTPGAGSADVTLLTPTVTFNAGATDPIPVLVEVHGDDEYELDEVFRLTLTNLQSTNPNHTIDPSNDEIDVTIINEDPAPTWAWQTASSTLNTTGNYFIRIVQSGPASIALGAQITATASSNLSVVTVLPRTNPGEQFVDVGFEVTGLPLVTPEVVTITITSLPGQTVPVLGSPVDHVVTLNPIATGTPLIRLDAPPSASIVEDDNVYSVEVDVANGVPIDDDVYVFVEAIDGPVGDPATWGTDWAFTGAGGANQTQPYQVLGPGHNIFRFQMPRDPVNPGESRVNLFYRIYLTPGAEPQETFRFTIVAAQYDPILGVGEQLDIAPQREQTVYILDSENASEQLHGLAPPRQAIPGGTASNGTPAQPDIIVLRDGVESGRIQVTNLHVAPLVPGSDAFARDLNDAGWTATNQSFEIPYSNAGGVAVAMRVALFVWYAKNFGKNSGYVDTWTGEVQGAGTPDHVWLQDPAHIPVEGQYPVVIWLSPNGTSSGGAGAPYEYHKDLSGTAQLAPLQTPSGTSRRAYWDASVGCPLMRDIIFVGDGNVGLGEVPQTTVPHMEWGDEGGNWNWSVPTPLSAQNPPGSWPATFDNIRFQGVTFKRNAGEPLGGTGSQDINIKGRAFPNGMLKLYDVFLAGSDVREPSGTTAGTTHKWGVHNSPSFMPDFRNVGCDSCVEHCVYGKYNAPHGYYIDFWQDWRGNTGGNASQTLRHVDRGRADCQGEGSLRDSGGLDNSILLYLRCHGRNGGWNAVTGLAGQNDANFRPESFNGTIYFRDTMATGRRDSGSEPSRGGFVWVRPHSIWSKNGAKRYDYEQPGGAALTVQWQNWPLGRARPAGGWVQHTFAATSELMTNGHRAVRMLGTPGTTGASFPAQGCAFKTNAFGCDEEVNECPAAAQDFSAGRWATRKVIFHNLSLRNDNAPSGGGTGGHDLMRVDGARELEIIIDSTGPVYLADGGFDWQGNPTVPPNQQEVTKTLRPGPGQTTPQLSINNWQSKDDGHCPFGHGIEEAVGLVKWNIVGFESNPGDADWWEPGPSGPQIRHGLVGGESEPSTTSHTDWSDDVMFGHHPAGSPQNLTPSQINTYDGSDPT